MEKINVKIEFERVVKYSVNTGIGLEDFEKIRDLDYDEIPMYKKENGKIVGNEIYEILNEFAEDYNESDWGEELLNVTVTELND